MSASVIVEVVAPVDNHGPRLDLSRKVIAGQHFVFQGGEERLGGSIVEARSDPAHRLPNTEPAGTAW